MQIGIGMKRQPVGRAMEVCSTGMEVASITGHKAFRC